jgi:hypothetical protein
VVAEEALNVHRVEDGPPAWLHGSLVYDRRCAHVGAAKALEGAAVQHHFERRLVESASKIMTADP